MKENISSSQFNKVKKETDNFISNLNYIDDEYNEKNLYSIQELCSGFSQKISSILEGLSDKKIRTLKHNSLNRLGFLTVSASNLILSHEIKKDFYNKNSISKINKEVDLIKSTIGDQMDSLSVFKESIDIETHNSEDLILKLQDYVKLAEKYNLKMNIINNLNSAKEFNANFGILFNLIYNIIDNAYKHGGNLDKIEFEIFNNPDGVKILISDNGDGIKIKDKKSIFKFGVTDGNGTGIGLSMMKDSLGLFGGNVEVMNYSKFGGADFLISLPFKEK